MTKIRITFPDGSSKNFKKGITGLEIVKSIGSGLAKSAVAASVNDGLIDLNKKINSDSKIEILTFDTHGGKEVFHHSTAHLMAQAVLRLFPKAKLTIGPTIEGGFYYDIDIKPLKPKDLEKIEQEMKKIVEENLAVKRVDITRKKAIQLFKKNKYKTEMIEDMPKNEKISYYEQGEFKDLCKGPHIPNTGMIKAFKLTKVSSAYWRGNSKNKSLQRIYGVSFLEKKQLKKYLRLQIEAEKRDHRKIGKELEWFTFHEQSPGSAFFHNKGTIIYNELISFLREEYKKRGYQEVITPLIYDKSLWETSGHWEHFKEDMFTLTVDGREFALKPMNCPSHCLMYLNSTKSYRDLPFRMTDFAPLHRNELKGVLAGLTRVRKFCQDDAHIFCEPDQLEEEMSRLLDFTNYIYKDVFKMDYHLELSTRPEKAMGSKTIWRKAEKALESALKKNGLKYKINPGDGAFYGPKIDLHIKDSIGRNWQCATIQLDFNLPERFKLKYEGKDGKKHQPIMIHRALFGSIDRFMGVMIEHFAGKLPLWLSPEQVRILTVAERFKGYAHKSAEKIRVAGIRVGVDDRAESIGKKVREAQVEKINYILVVGEKELKNKSVAVRTFDNKFHGEKKISLFIKQLITEVKEKTI
ncbi:threonine--tRNA ligase [Candidatus Woesearchaeota archaeon]|jgi:threonyl-tRNA synthetase|nr:threonine--tRNA ligase [Candidatus Woesearchaeota archaeon]